MRILALLFLMSAILAACSSPPSVDQGYMAGLRQRLLQYDQEITKEDRALHARFAAPSFVKAQARSWIAETTRATVRGAEINGRRNLLARFVDGPARGGEIDSMTAWLQNQAAILKAYDAEARATAADFAVRRMSSYPNGHAWLAALQRAAVERGSVDGAAKEIIAIWKDLSQYAADRRAASGATIMRQEQAERSLSRLTQGAAAHSFEQQLAAAYKQKIAQGRGFVCLKQGAFAACGS